VIGGLSVGAVHVARGPSENPSPKVILSERGAEPARLEASPREPSLAGAELPAKGAGAEETTVEAPSGAERRRATSPKGTRPEIASPAPLPPSPVTPLSAEVTELDRARAALTAGNPERALAVLDAYRQKFPEGTLRPESAYVRIQAVLQRGDRAGARELASRFLAQHPNSPHAPQLRALAAP
jgi:TolA-binding protein